VRHHFQFKEGGKKERAYQTKREKKKPATAFDNSTGEKVVFRKELRYDRGDIRGRKEISRRGSESVGEEMDCGLLQETLGRGENIVGGNECGKRATW